MGDSLFCEFYTVRLTAPCVLQQALCDLALAGQAEREALWVCQ